MGQLRRKILFATFFIRVTAWCEILPLPSATVKRPACGSRNIDFAPLVTRALSDYMFSLSTFKVKAAAAATAVAEANTNIQVFTASQMPFIVH
jgi:hypothetical protein